VSKLPVTLKKIKELEYEARRTGHPEKRAKFSNAKREYETLKSVLFDEEFPYAESPSESFVEQLREAAESGEEVAIFRYQMMKERREMVERGIRGDDVKELRASEEELRRLLESGEAITAAHLESASRVAIDNGSIDNRVLYSTIKTRYQAQQEGTYEPPSNDEPTKVTGEDIEAAGEKAQRSGRIEDRVAYATLRRQYAEQEESANP
jgi:hypothetical protein